MFNIYIRISGLKQHDCVHISICFAMGSTGMHTWPAQVIFLPPFHIRTKQTTWVIEWYQELNGASLRAGIVYFPPVFSQWGRRNNNKKRMEKHTITSPHFHPDSKSLTEYWRRLLNPQFWPRPKSCNILHDFHFCMCAIHLGFSLWKCWWTFSDINLEEKIRRWCRPHLHVLHSMDIPHCQFMGCLVLDNISLLTQHWQGEQNCTCTPPHAYLTQLELCTSLSMYKLYACWLCSKVMVNALRGSPHKHNSVLPH